MVIICAMSLHEFLDCYLRRRCLSPHSPMQNRAHLHMNKDEVSPYERPQRGYHNRQNISLFSQDLRTPYLHNGIQQWNRIHWSLSPTFLGRYLSEGRCIQIIIMWCSPTTLLAHQFPSVTLCHIFPSGNKQATAIKVSFVLCVDHCIYNRENTFRSGSLVNLIRNRTAEVIAFENWYPNKIFWWFRKTEPAIRCHLQNRRMKRCYTIQMKLTVILE